MLIACLTSLICGIWLARRILVHWSKSCWVYLVETPCEIVWHRREVLKIRKSMLGTKHLLVAKSQIKYGRRMGAIAFILVLQLLFLHRWYYYFGNASQQQYALMLCFDACAEVWGSCYKTLGSTHALFLSLKRFVWMSHSDHHLITRAHGLQIRLWIFKRRHWVRLMWTPEGPNNFWRTLNRNNIFASALIWSSIHSLTYMEYISVPHPPPPPLPLTTHTHNTPSPTTLHYTTLHNTHTIHI